MGADREIRRGTQTFWREHLFLVCRTSDTDADSILIISADRREFEFDEVRRLR
jgi:hypothetical protein